MLNRGWPDDETLWAALALAVRAPSVHNAQPWRFRIGDRGLHLFLDPQQAQSSTGADLRDAVMSCGAALHHLRIALAAAGWSAVVRRLPDPANPQHLAWIGLVRHRPTMLERALSNAISRRQTDRRSFDPAPIPPGYVGLLNERVATLGASVRQAVDTTRERLVDVLQESASGDSRTPEHRLELADWSGRPTPSNGIAAQRIPPRAQSLAELETGYFSTGNSGLDFAELLVLGTSTDDRLAHLSAGEALSAVLLTATNVGLATGVLTEPLEAPELRRRIRVGVLENRAYPQAVVRIGWGPADGVALPVTPRRTVAEVLDHCEMVRR
ncbi:Acg family FMN-binding oxidoreductase [Nocardia sp. NPDC049149]|uniref:Acg family FMN-binding oxidoreductase n=1 Tax=Nocardia sp. NPDC049149 TaxID=3364315 RepID=UPI00371078AD